MRAVFLSLVLLAACGEDAPAPATPAEPAPAPVPAGPDASALASQANAIFKPLPEWMGDKPSDEMVALGRQLYYEKRLSKNHDISCNSCHQLDNFGQDGEPTSPGHKGQRGGRNSPTSLNAALHIAQFWDGRAEDVEAQAKGPILNPIEMAIADEATAVAVIESIPGYSPMFEAAFGDAGVTYDRIADAIGAFERGLVTPSPVDAFLKGDASALNAEQLAGMKTYMDVGCTSCHNGVGVGGAGYFKLGMVQPYETKDLGRFDLTQQESDKYVFKAPSLRNVTRTGPYLHDGSITDLGEMVRIMGASAGQGTRRRTGEGHRDVPRRTRGHGRRCLRQGARGTRCRSQDAQPRPELKRPGAARPWFLRACAGPARHAMDAQDLAAGPGGRPTLLRSIHAAVAARRVPPVGGERGRRNRGGPVRGLRAVESGTLRGSLVFHIPPAPTCDGHCLRRG